jgi:uncharacterized protein YjiS (DUF1127 family)
MPGLKKFPLSGGRAITRFTGVNLPKGSSAVSALNHPAAIGAGINHAPTPARFDITGAPAHHEKSARSGAATSRWRESLAWRLCGRLLSAAVAGIRVMRAVPSNRGVVDLGPHQLRDIGLEYSNFATPAAGSLELLLLFAGHAVPRTHLAPPLRVRERAASPIDAARRALRILSKWRERIRERHLLASLDDRALRDIRLSRYDVERDTRKPFWRA